MLQGQIQGSTSYANDEVVFPSYEMLNRLKNVSEVSLYNQAIYAYFPVGFDAQSSLRDFPRQPLILKHVV